MGLGSSRLSIVDLEGGKQPMPNEDGSVQVLFSMIKHITRVGKG